MKQAENEVRRPAAEKRTVLYTVARCLVGVLFRTLGPVRYYHKERAQLKAPFILVSNHWSNMDPLLAAFPVRGLEVTFLGKKELVAVPFLKWLLNALHMIPIDRHNRDMEAMRACSRALKDSAVLGIFPEGTRHHQGVMEETEDGMALIALRARVPVLPVYIEKKYRMFHVNRVCIGEPLDIQDLCEEGVNRETCALLMDRLKASYRAMQAEIQSVQGK